MSAAPRARDDETAARVVMAWPSAAAATDQPRDSEPVGEVASSGRRPTELLDVVRHLTVLQIDPTAAIAPTADLVAWSRLGPSYSPAELLTALEDRMLLEHRAMIRPSEDLALYRADMADWPGRGELRDWQGPGRFSSSVSRPVTVQVVLSCVWSEMGCFEQPKQALDWAEDSQGASDTRWVNESMIGDVYLDAFRA